MPRLLAIISCLIIVAANSVRADSPDDAAAGRSTLRIRASAPKSEPQRLATPAAGTVTQSAPVVKPAVATSSLPGAAEEGPAGIENVPAPLVAPRTIPDTASVRVPGPGPFFSATPGCDVLGPSPCNCNFDGHRGCGCLFGTGQYCPAPLGQCVFSAMTPQVVNGWAAQMVFYRFDFSAPTDTKGEAHDASALAPAGWKRVAKVADILGHAAGPPVIIEASDNFQLDEARRQNVIAALTQFCGTPISDQWVIVGPPPAGQLRGKEAVIINDNLLRQTLNGGAFAPNDRYSGNGVNPTSGNDNLVNR